MSSMIKCPHCYTEFFTTKNYCPNCGRDLPEDPGDSAAGVRMRSEAEREQVGQAVALRLGTAVLVHLISGAIMLFTASGAKVEAESEMYGFPFAVVAIIAGSGIVFAALAMWSQRNPMAAALASLLLCIGVGVANALLSEQWLLRDLVPRLAMLVFIVWAIILAAQDTSGEQDMW